MLPAAARARRDLRKVHSLDDCEAEHFCSLLDKLAEADDLCEFKHTLEHVYDLAEKFGIGIDSSDS